MAGENKLYLSFHGRIIDSLGIQMYQSPVAAVAELIANAWDADATSVQVGLPDDLSGTPVITVADNGIGMTFGDCQNLYLDVGRNRRATKNGASSLGGRPVLGRQGIGKFAGFGIADVLEVETVSKETGEKTKFLLDLEKLRSDAYASTNQKEIEVLEKTGPDNTRKSKNGTIIKLRNLKLRRTPSETVFAESMARRFLVAQTASNFSISVNDIPLPKDNALSNVQFDFPNDYKEKEIPDGMRNDNGVGIERVGSDEIKWRIRFTKNTIGNEELRGVSVFCGIKLAQTPFFFHLSGGLDGQHGQQYISGQVQADFLDQLDEDLITTERQRINWELDEAHPLLIWGQDRVKSLLAIWKGRRAEDKIEKIEKKLTSFSARLEKLEPSEQHTVRQALKKIGSIEALSDIQFEEISDGILTAWEAGRLRELINRVSALGNIDEIEFLKILAEAHVLNALHVAEVVKTKVGIIDGLRAMIEKKDRENSLRDYIAKNPWLISPEWETFKIETKVKHLIEASAKEVGMENDERWNGRIDLALASGQHLLVIEFMRPGLTIDRDHINRYQEYIDVLRPKVRANTELGFKDVSGLLVADRLDRGRGIADLLARLADANMKASDWKTLLARAHSQWEEFLDILVERAPNDPRLASLRQEKPSNS